MRDIVGVWRLVATSAVDGAGRPLPPPYGPRPTGTVTFDAQGRMTAVLCDGRSSLPDGAAREYNSYCGDYRFDGETLVTRVDAASTQARMGTDQVRAVRFDGARMILRPPPVPLGDGVQQRELVWERVG
jgi:hypothetical protein